ncbi:hypothetical protein BHE74_00011083 [Ensete ventricosum]|nr:hypothetical protein BHE74_00011083 [Ensete ventricosum]
MKSCHDFDSVVSLELLGTIRKRYSIPNEYVLYTPRPSLSLAFGDMCQSLYLLVLLPDHYDSFLVLQRCEHESHERKVLGRAKQASDVALEVDLAPLTHGTQIWHDERASVRYLQGTQIPRLAVDLYTLLSEVLMDKATKTIVLGQLAEVQERLDDSEEQLRSSQTKIQQIELLKMTWAKDQFWVNLPREAVEDYKNSPNFEIGLVWMGRVLLQYNYQLVLAWLRAGHLELEIEPDPFT